MERPPEKQGFLARLFGRRPSGKGVVFKEKEHRKPQEQEWAPIDLSSGRFQHKELYTDRERFKFNLNKDLKNVVRGAGDRSELISGIRKIGSRQGIGNLEMKKFLRKEREKGKITRFQEKQLRRKFGVR